MAQTTVAESSSPFVGDYYASWSRKVLASSNTNEGQTTPRIVAVITMKGKTDDIILVTAQGELISYSKTDWIRLAWRCQLLPSATGTWPKNRFGAFHAVYDEGSDRFYFVLAALYDDTSIYWVNRSDCVSKGRVAVNALAMVSAAEPDDELGPRHFLGIAVDPTRRLLYASACNRDVSVWLLPSDDVDRAAKLVTTVDCHEIGVDPRYCAFFVDAANKQLLLAVSDFIHNIVSLLAVNTEAFDTLIDQVRRSDEQINATAFKEICFIKNYKKRPMHRDFVNGPCELCFDPAGNLFVADRGSNRLQVFNFAHDSSGKLQANNLWQSPPIPGLWRLALSVGTKSNKPCAIVAGAQITENGIISYYFD